MEVICLDFMNSQWQDWRGSGRHEDRLDKVSWVEDFLAHWKLTAPVPMDQQTRIELGVLRDRLRAMVEAHVAGAELERVDVNLLNLMLKRVPAHLCLVSSSEGYRLEQETSAEGWDLVMGRIASSFVQLLASNDAHRLKICLNEDCRWIFYDESRNRTRRWCDDKCCGNLLKVRRFRERKKQEQE